MSTAALAEAGVETRVGEVTLKAGPLRRALPAMKGLTNVQGLLHLVSTPEDGMWLEGSDLSIQVSKRVLPPGEVPGIIDVSIAARALRSFLQGCGPADTELTISVSGTDIRLAAQVGAVSWEVTLKGPEDDAVSWPMVAAPPVTAETIGTFDPHLVRQVLRAASNDEFRPILTALHVTPRTLTATDAYRIMHVEYQDPRFNVPDDGVLVPAAALRPFAARTDQFTVRHEGTAIEAATDDLRVTCRFLQGEFPKISTFLKSDPFPLQFMFPDRVALLQSVFRARDISDHTPVEFAPQGDGTVELQCRTMFDGSAVSRVPGELRGVDTKVAFNPHYLADLIDTTDGAGIVLEGTDQIKPWHVRTDLDDGAVLRALLMPVRIT